jgi:hypothetical protein
MSVAPMLKVCLMDFSVSSIQRTSNDLDWRLRHFNSFCRLEYKQQVNKSLIVGKVDDGADIIGFSCCRCTQQSIEKIIFSSLTNAESQRLKDQKKYAALV